MDDVPRCSLNLNLKPEINRGVRLQAITREFRTICNYPPIWPARAPCLIKLWTLPIGRWDGNTTFCWSSEHFPVSPKVQYIGKPDIETRSRPTLCRGIMKIRPIRPTFWMLQTVPDPGSRLNLDPLVRDWPTRWNLGRLEPGKVGRPDRLHSLMMLSNLIEWIW